MGRFYTAGRIDEKWQPTFRKRLKIDDLVKSRKIPFFVIPDFGELSRVAKAGIQFFNWLQSFWTPVFTGVTTFYETIKIKDLTIEYGFAQALRFRICCCVSLDEIPQIRFLVIRQIPKLHTTLPRLKTDRCFTVYFEIRNSINPHLIQMKTTIGQ